MNKERHEDLMYEAGLTADGCWDQMDEYDKAAIIKYGELICKEERERCAKICEELWKETGRDAWADDCAKAIYGRDGK